MHSKLKYMLQTLKTQCDIALINSLAKLVNHTGDWLKMHKEPLWFKHATETALSLQRFIDELQYFSYIVIDIFSKIWSCWKEHSGKRFEYTHLKI